VKILENIEDKLRIRAEDLLSTHGKAEKVAWLQNPITVAYLSSVKADYMHALTAFSGGEFIRDTVDKTALEAIALHVKLQDLQDVIQSIEEIVEDHDEETQEDTNTSGTQATY
jgi:hypothetical protein